LTHIPYKGSAPAVTDLIGGQVQALFDNVPNVIQHVKAGRLRDCPDTKFVPWPKPRNARMHA
jgi:tripartite-type tricarboxylate transporter receptor subunit TctC